MENKFLHTLLETKCLKNSLYSILKHSFLYHSNKIEGSTFTTESLALLLDKNVVTGKHTLDDVQETVNSSLMFNTTLHAKGFSGIYKTIPNMIIGTDTKVAQPFEVEPKLDELFEWYYSLENVTLDDIAEFHYRFELIHPFQDGNGRIGRFLMLKQMLENDLPIVIVSWDTEDLYRNSLKLCSIGNYSPLSSYLKTLTDFREDYKAFWN